MPFIGAHCKNLTTLECKFNDNSFIDNADDFVQAFTQLDKLKCIKITMNHNYLNKTINLSAIIDSLPEKINEIHLFSEPWWEVKRNISMCVQRFRNLQKLTSVGLCLDNIILNEIADITTLVYLNIEIYDTYENLSLFNKLVNLEYINLTMGISKYKPQILSTEVLNTIFSTCKNLKHLDMTSGSYDIADIPLRKWINFQNLQHLGISCDIMPDLANTIVKYCKNLKHLRIPNYYGNDTYAFKKLTELENLECLILDGPIDLHEDSIIAISNNCKKLQRLEIPSCTIKPAIDDVPLSSPSVLDELSKLQYLEHLNLRDAKNLADSTIIAIANNCKNLKSLDITACTDLTEAALVALTNLKNLQKLNVECLDIVTDSFLIKLKGIKELYCDDCQNFTDAGIIQFIKNNPDLEKISVRYINNITVDIVIAADQATKNRTNGIILHIIMDSFFIFEAKPIIKSQWFKKSFLVP
ncbi:uncharacterized protein LOC122847322 [Aphidius gifuensis]|uniref:uncharacterized protein LOC122847322 n=1 Tax=Aphidius gifuensis TaxID=684658 RepID=UPI001CDCF345|nr:uncharacterized protein LOC122847322 [Aphidius gifuensis]